MLDALTMMPDHRLIKLISKLGHGLLLIDVQAVDSSSAIAQECNHTAATLGGP